MGLGDLELRVCVFAMVIGGEEVSGKVRGQRQRQRGTGERARHKKRKHERQKGEKEKKGERDSYQNGEAEKLR